MAVTFVAAGGGTGGTADITPALPTGIGLGDILVLVVESGGAEPVSTPSGWNLLDQAYATGDTATGTQLTVFWKRVEGGESAPTVTDPGDHVVGRIAAYRGCKMQGNPWNQVTGGVDSSAGTSVSITGVTTTAADCLVLNIIASPFDTNVADQVNGWTNGNLSTTNERFDNFTTSGNGGGIGMWEGYKTTAGATGATSVTLTNAAVTAFMTVALEPAVSSTHIATTTESNAAGGTVDDITIAKPSGTLQDHVMVACIYKAADSVHTITGPSGWLQVSTSPIDTTNINASVWYKVAGGSEPANYTWQVSAAGVWGASISTLSGINTTTPIHQDGGSSYTTADPATAPTVNTSITSHILTFRASRDDATAEVTHTAQGTAFELADWGNDGGASTRNGAVYLTEWVPAKATAGGLIVDPSGTVTNGVMFTVALTPAGLDVDASAETTTAAATANAPRAGAGGASGAVSGVTAANKPVPGVTTRAQSIG